MEFLILFWRGSRFKLPKSRIFHTYQENGWIFSDYLLKRYHFAVIVVTSLPWNHSFPGQPALDATGLQISFQEWSNKNPGSISSF
ncbi:MAG: hypothetical protein KGM98_06615, partial [Bacteroidota bacterium]|nr:hypothetical protein [Bacteroidota bacterium]